jgi:CrcB protein
MDTVAKILLVGGGGFLGANARYWLGGWVQERLGATFPWQTMLINISGSLLIGLFMGLSGGLIWNPNWRLFVALGILGGYTTFSTFGYEAVVMLQQKEYSRALFYIEGSALLSVLGAWLGIVLSRMVLGGRS